VAQGTDRSQFDAILTAVEPCTPPRAETADMEPFCVKCNALMGVFQAHGPDCRHYRGLVTATSKPKPHKADHAPVIGWRPASRPTRPDSRNGRRLITSAVRDCLRANVLTDIIDRCRLL
jgi:hypothetical protein